MRLWDLFYEVCWREWPLLALLLYIYSSSAAPPKSSCGIYAKTKASDWVLGLLRQGRLAKEMVRKGGRNGKRPAALQLN